VNGEKNYQKELSSPHEPVHDVVMMFLNLIPIVGPAAAMLGGRIWPDPGQIARDRFMVTLAQKVDALLARTEIEAALEKPASAALLSHALNIASHTFAEGKLEALRNATVNGVFHSPDNANLTSIVFGVLDQMIEGHITLLRAIADRKHNGIPWPWAEAKLIGVRVSNNTEGMKSPESVLPDETGERYVDRTAIQTNEILLTDLVNLGLVEERIQSPGPIYEWSTDPSKNMPGFAWPTAKGLMVLELITEPPTPTGSPEGR
jgi:hypothetical protein